MSDPQRPQQAQSAVSEALLLTLVLQVYAHMICLTITQMHKQKNVNRGHQFSIVNNNRFI